MLEKWPKDQESRQTESLIEPVKLKVHLLLKACGRKRLDLTIFSARRGPEAQARMWCRSRTLLEVQSQRRLLELAEAPRLASLLKDEYASTGRWATDRLPGQSWHQWGEACDLFVEVGGKAAWIDGRLTTVCAPLVKDLGLESGATWARGRDPNHVQFRREATPNLMEGGCSWFDIEQTMRKIYYID